MAIRRPLANQKSQGSFRAASPQGLMQPGQQIGRYVLTRHIGHGGSGSVFAARHVDGRQVAVKILSVRVAEDEVRRLRFYQEAKIAMQIAHANLVRAYEVGEDRGRHYLAMEFVSGDSLAQKVVDEGRLDESLALKIAIEVARALRAVHRHGVIHRDVSPKNVMLTREGRIKLADLEFSKQKDLDLDLTMTGTGLGTPDYMSPEQFRRAKEVDHRSDIYGLGATMFVMTTGRLPFERMTDLEKLLAKSKNEFPEPESVNPNLSAATATLIKQCMQASPGGRPQTATQFIKAARACLSALAQEARVEKNRVQLRVVFLDPSGASRTFTASPEELIQMLRTGQAPRDARVADPGSDTFVPIDRHAVYREAFPRWTRRCASAAAAVASWVTEVCRWILPGGKRSAPESVNKTTPTNGTAANGTAANGTPGNSKSPDS